MCFEILGFDIMFDTQLKPYLIEINQSPSFKTDSPLDFQIKRNVIKDAFSMLYFDESKKELDIDTQIAKRDRQFEMNKGNYQRI